MDSGAPPGLELSVYPLDSASLDSLPSKGILEMQKIGEVRSAAGATDNLSTYTFPRRRLNLVQNDSSRKPLVLVACGQPSVDLFFPGHIFFDTGQDPFRRSHSYICGCLRWLLIISSSTLTMKLSEVLVISSLQAFLFLHPNNHAQYLSPVADAYKKVGLASAHHRMRMCELATQYSSSSIDLDKWEALQEEYQPTAYVLDHFSQEVNSQTGGRGSESGNGRPARIALLAGADLLQSMNIPGVWSDESLSHIMTHYPLFILERHGTDIEAAKALLARWKGDIHVIPQTIQNDVSSTKIRKLRRDGMSIRYLVPDEVLKYIEEQGLYAGEVSGRGSKRDE